MTYDEAMHALSDAAHEAVRAADNEDGAPVGALRNLAAEIESLIDYRCTRDEVRDMVALYKGARLAGLVGREGV